MKEVGREEGGRRKGTEEDRQHSVVDKDLAVLLKYLIFHKAPGSSDSASPICCGVSGGNRIDSEEAVLCEQRHNYVNLSESKTNSASPYCWMRETEPHQ